jgi:formate hydrogenlyase subunit 4
MCGWIHTLTPCLLVETLDGGTNVIIFLYLCELAQLFVDLAAATTIYLHITR